MFAGRSDYQLAKEVDLEQRIFDLQSTDHGIFAWTVTDYAN